MVSSKKDFIEIDNKKIGNKFKPYIVAEMSGNHNGDIKNALRLLSPLKNRCRRHQITNL